MVSKHEVLTAGFAQFPKGTSIYETQKVIACILIINEETQTIKEASFTFISKTTNNFLSQLLEGKEIADGVESIIEDIHKKVYIPGKKAVIQSIISAYKNYKEGKRELQKK